MTAVRESAEFGPSGWPYVVVFPGDRISILGWDPINELGADATRLGKIALDGVDRPLPVFGVDIDGRRLRIAIDEVSNGVFVVACNDATIECLKQQCKP